MFITSLRTGLDSILVAMQGSIYLFCQFFADAGRLGDLHGAGASQLLQAAEVFQQLSASFRTHPGDSFEGGGVSGLAAALAVAGNGEAVRLVANMLNQVQRR